MKVNELKAWLEGFKEGMKGAPTKAQWDKINKKIDEIETSTGWHTAVERPVTSDVAAIKWTTRTEFPYVQTNAIGVEDFYKWGPLDTTSGHN